jgi:competence protein ComGC
MADFFAELLKIFSEPTWRKIAMVLSLVLASLVALLVYERYTASFRLSRLQKETELLTRLQEIQNRGTNRSPDLDRAQMALVVQTVQAIEEKPFALEFVPTRLTFSMDSLWKFFAGGTIWWVYGLFQLSKIKTKEGKKEFYGTLSIALIMGFFAMFVPPIWWPWFHIFIYPWLLMVAVIVVLLPLAIPAFGRAKKKAQSINCSNNLKQVGLAALQWSLDHEDVFPSDLSSMKKELGTDKITCCPADNAVPYQILSPGVAGNDSSVVYARCPIHGLVILVNGSVQQVGKRKLVQKDGKWVIE